MNNRVIVFGAEHYNPLGITRTWERRNRSDSMMTSNGRINASKYKKIVWAIIEATIAYVLLSAGSLKALQTSSIAASLPYLFIMIAMVPAIMKEIRKNNIDITDKET